MKSNLKVLTTLSLLLYVFAFSKPFTTTAQDSLPLAADLEPTILVKWMQLLYDRIEAEKISAPAASRLYAYAGVTAYQSILPGMPDGISMSGQVTALPDMPWIDEEKSYDWISVENGALSTVFAGLFPETAADTQNAITALRDAEAKARIGALDEQTVEDSLAYGEEVAAVILEWVASDNFAETRTMTWDIPAGDPSLWVITAEGMKPVEPFWGQIRPFALYSADACAVQPNLTFEETDGSSFYLQALEVKETGDNLTNEQKDIARFWVDTPGETGTPAGHWILIENQVIDILDLKLERASMMYGLVGLALGDSFISAWSLKYQVNLLRPVTYIQNYIDKNWKPFIASPGFPEYPSGHSVVSEAAAEVLTGMFGTVAFTDRSGRKHNLGERSFTSFEAAATEAAISRLYGGIHYRAAIENGMRQGRCIGRNVLDYITLRSQPQGE
ncbi:MAG: vanadium-dependent haloperoxidase [Chloroflexi bacterium]|nr:vanadium-dependent haloperoxidase [Chloroflexota bacterium]MCC6897083.1 vanadium-dependent haloperoxidase [Anaerolineae bacterium]